MPIFMSESPLMATLWLLLLNLLALYFNQASAKLEFLPFRHEVRLHYNAPPDLLVVTVKAINVAQPDVEILYSLHKVNDYKYFRVEPSTGNIYTTDYVYLRTGNNLTIMVVAYDQSEALVKQLDVRITEYNRQKPAFEYDVYRTEISFTEEVNITLLRVHATDNDSVSYNAELYYSLIPGNWSDYFQIDASTGEIQLQYKLTQDIKHVKLDVLVEDGGSPVRNNTAIVEIAVKAITEPRRVRHTNPMSQSVDICWDRPLVGNVTGYLVRYREIGASKEDVQDMNVTAKNLTHVGSGFCTKLKGLKPWTDYEYRVNAWNKEEIGLGSEISTFGTRSNYCLHQPCRKGRCVPTVNNPGFICHCEEGYYGTTCNHFNPCVRNPCGDYGECRNISDSKYACHCNDGYTGVNCSAYDPCLTRPPPCANGATCISSAHSTYQCVCVKGYYGPSCTSYNSCASNPCKNGGVCINTTQSDFRCYCTVGFVGRYCELDIDDCLSSPCANGARCIDKPNGYDCQCPPGYSGDLCTDKEYCSEERTKTNHGVFYWPKSHVNETRRAKCPDGPFDRRFEVPLFAYRTCKYEINRGAVWSHLDASKCETEGFNIANNVTDKLNQLTSSPKNLSATQFHTAANEITSVYNYALHDKNIADKMLSVISNMLDVDEELFDKDNESSRVTDRLIDVVKNYTSSVTLDQGKSVEFRSDNLVIKAMSWKNDLSITTNKYTTIKGVKFVGNRKPSTTNKTEAFKPLEDDTEEDDVAAIVVPDEALGKAEITDNEEVRLQFISFKNAKFFRGRNNTKPYPNDPWQPVIIANIANTTIANLTAPVTYKIPTTSNKTYKCAYWNEIDKEWSYDGITTNQTENFTWCHSTHMTAFSVLFDPDPNFQLDDKHKAALSIISYVGCAFSIVGLLLTILTYSIFRCLNRDRSGKILLSLCVAMLLMNASFLVGSQSQKTHVVDLCVTVAILTHYFLLTTLAWMCVEAINMYQMLIYVFASAETHFMLKRSIAAWGLPLIVVGTTAGIDIGYYHSKNEYCILSPENPYVYYISFLGPSCIILFINCIVFILVSRVLFQPRLTGRVNQKDKKMTLAQVRGAFTVMTLLGVTWVFGALAVGSAKVPFQYIFCILNSLQGFIIFLVRCIQYPEARSAWMQLVNTGTFKKYRGGANLSGSSNSQCIRGANDHSATSRTLSGGTTSTTLEKERKLSIASLTQFFKGGAQRRRSSTSPKASGKRKEGYERNESNEKKDEERNDVEEVNKNEEMGAKKEKDTQRRHYSCSMADFRREIESKAPVDTPALHGLNEDELPFIEDESPGPANKEQSLDQGYSSLENSPNSSRILPESISSVQVEGIESIPRKTSLPNALTEVENDKKVLPRSLTNPIIMTCNLVEQSNSLENLNVADASQQTEDDEEIEKIAATISQTVNKMTSFIDDCEQVVNISA